MTTKPMTTMVQLTIIRIEEYGPWTLTLGSDREAQLQMLQARIYHDVQRLFSEKDCIVFFNRFDEYFAVTNGLSVADHAALQHELAKLYGDLRMSMAIGAGRTAFEANLNAYRARKEKENKKASGSSSPPPSSLLLFSAKDIDAAGTFFNDEQRSSGNDYYDHGHAYHHNHHHQQQQAEKKEEEEGSVQIMHIDIDGSTKVSAQLSPYEITALVVKLYSRLAEEFLKHDSLAFFLGGDNFMAISNGVTRDQADAIIKKVTAGIGIRLNCGIGIGRTGRRAAEAATRALDTIRELRKEGKIQTIYEVRCP